MWTKEDLQNLIKEKMGEYYFLVVSNRQPYEHIFSRGKIVPQKMPGGVVTALDPVMRACHGTWVAFGNGEADTKVTDAAGCVNVPPEDPAYKLKRVWLTKKEEECYYYGYANDALWPLCHTAFQRPTFKKEDWDFYVKVNQKFAQAVIEEIGDRKAFVWIQDYHLCLLPKMLKEMAGNQIITAHFWHIPWPSFEAFRICPQQVELLEGLLANDLVGFHIQYHCLNFLDVIDRLLESKIDREQFSVVKNNHQTLIRPYPISVDFEAVNRIAQTPETKTIQENLIEEFELKGARLLLGIDRIDYTKGIPERLMAVDRLLEKFPELREKVVFLQVGVPSRVHLAKYRAINDEINMLVEEINWKYSTGNWSPIIFSHRYMSFNEILALYTLADVCVVSSLHDGMNLVAKEFVASRFDEKGVLVLSEFTGSARELTDALLVNPFDCEKMAETILKALNLPEEEARKRMIKMRHLVQENNIFHWAGKVISELLKFEFEEAGTKP